jgi:integrase
VAIWANQADPDFCPAMALRDWLNFRKKGDDKDAEDFEDRPLFCSIPKGGRITGEKLSDKAVVRLVKDLARLAGYGDEVNFSGHSLRSGLVTVAAEAGAELPGVMRQARHTAPATTMRYYRPSDLWKNNVTAGIFRE